MTNESKMVLCECGYCGPISKFCPECGKKFESPAEGVGQEMKEYICECGTVVTSDEKLIYEYYSNEIKGRRYISASVLDAAYAIIKEYHIDEWEKYKDRFTGMMGGSVSVWYRDGDQLVGSSLDHMGSAVQGAYGALMALFHENIL